MKPDFALSLSFDGIRLLQRAPGGWLRVGEVAVDVDDLPKALRQLRRKAVALKTGALRTKLIIPDDQIRYLSIETGELPTDARRAAALAALDGATPYPVDALAVDISADGAMTYVAAVAQETLAEAEAFATEHRFNPVGFVAAPGTASFVGEPFFGTTGAAADLLRAGDAPERETASVVVIGTVEDTATPEAPADPAPAIEAETDSESAAPDTFSEALTIPPVPPKPPEADVQEAAPTPSPPPEAPPQVDIAAPDPDPVAVASVDPAPQAPVADEPKAAPEAQTEDLAASDDPDQPDAALPPDDVTTPPLLGFATRRRPNAGKSAAPLGGVTRDTTAPPRPAPPPLRAAPPPAPPPAAPANPSVTHPPAATTRSLTASPPPPAPDPPAPATAAAIPPEPAPQAAAARVGGFLSRRKPLRKAPAPDTASTPAATQPATPTAEMEAQRLTVFGARADATVGGKPRFLGLILTAILLVFLAGVAAWASVFLDDGLARLFDGRDRTLASTLPDDMQEDLADTVGQTTVITPDAVAPEAQEVVVAALNDSLTEGLTAEDVAVLDALRDPQPAPIEPEELDAAAREARYAVTGIWPKAPDTPAPGPAGQLDDIFVAGIDPVSPSLDAVALPDPGGFLTDTQIAAVASPAAAGTRFDFGADGRLVPTAQGTLSPDGFTVFLGKPPVLPPVWPARVDATAPLPEADAGTDTGAEAVDGLARIRPQPRPSNLIEQNERASLGGLSRAELAAFRPRLRPRAPQEEAQTAEADSTETLEAPETETAALPAVAPTLRPSARPRNFERTVARATRQAAPAPTRTAAIAPRTVTPAVPSAASVAREATVRNAINLNRVNLIGVYGTPSNRSALVRLSNGRYRKVQVGDRFDGGRVSAIGDSELRYQKGSRNVVLKMPSS